jgi:eukaryotic translation initiation factor 2C
VTQVLQAAKIKSDRGIDQYCGNVSMKIHCKLGGVTHQVLIPALDAKTMMIGADVRILAIPVFRTFLTGPFR